LAVDFHDLPVQVKTLYPRVVPDIPNNMNSCYNVIIANKNNNNKIYIQFFTSLFLKT